MQICNPRAWRASSAAMTPTARRARRTTRRASSAAKIADAALRAWARPAAAARNGLDSVYETIHLN